MSTTDSESTPDDAQESEIKSDDEWKQRVKAEDAAREASLKAEAEVDADTSESTAESEDETPTPSADDDAAAAATEDAADTESAAESMPMPPATFEMLVSMFSTQAMVAMGMIPNPATGKAEKTPDLAKHFIDLLGVLESKTEGNLEPQEKSLLDSSLHSLRMAFVQATK